MQATEKVTNHPSHKTLLAEVLTHSQNINHTPLLRAAKKGKTDVVSYLIKQKAELEGSRLVSEQ